MRINPKLLKKMSASFVSSIMLGNALLLPVTAYADVYVYQKYIKSLGVIPDSSLVVSTAFLSFADTAVNQSSNATVIVQNTGTADLPLTVGNVTGSDFSASTSCGSVLAAGASCNLLVSFAPSSTGSKTGTLSVNSTVISVSGTGTTGQGGFVAESSLLNFGEVSVGDSQIKTVSFSASHLMSGVSASLSALPSNNTSQLAIVSNSCGTPQSPVSGINTCSVALRYQPTNTSSAEVLDATLSLSAPDYSDSTVNLTGSSGYSHLTGAAASGSSSNFGAVLVGTTKTETFTLTNSGYSALSGVYGVLGNAATTGADPVLSATSTCGLDAMHAVTLGAGQSCSLVVTYTPTASTDILNSTLTAASTGANSVTLSLSGSALAALAISSSTGSVGAVNIGDTTKSLSFTIQNQSDSSLAGFNTSLTSASDAASFSYNATLANNSSCIGPVTLAPGEICTVTVHFSPNSTGLKQANIMAGSQLLTTSSLASVSGTGVQAAVSGSLVASSMSLMTINSSAGWSSNLHVSIKNGASEVASIANPSVNGTSLSGNVQVNDTGTYTVFVYDANNNLIANAGSVSVIATTTVPPSSLALSYSLPGDLTNKASFSITNSGAVYAAPISASITTNTSDNAYSVAVLASDGVSACSSIPTNGSCSVVVTMTPASATGLNSDATNTLSTYSGSLNVTIQGTPYSVALSGFKDSYSVTGSLVVNTDSTLLIGSNRVSVGGIKSASLVQNGNVYATASVVGGSIINSDSHHTYIHFTAPNTGAYDMYVYDINGKLMGLLHNVATADSYSQTLSANTSSAFGNVYVGSTSNLVFTVSNTGSGTLHSASSGLGAQLINGSGLSIAANTCGTSLVGGATCAITVAYAPTAVGSLASASLQIATTEVGNSSVSLSGNGVSPITVSSATGAFGNVNIGDVTKSLSISIQNQSNVALTNFAAVVTSASDSSSFSYNSVISGGSTSCASAVTLPVGETCVVTVAFNPVSTGSKQAYIAVSSSTYSNSSATSITGTGVQATITSGSMNSSTSSTLTVTSSISWPAGSTLQIKDGSTVVANISSPSISAGTISGTVTAPAAGSYTVYVLNSSGSTIANAGLLTSVAAGPVSALLMHMDSSIVDNSANGVTYSALGGGTSAITTAVSKIGTGSLQSDGTTYYGSTSFNANKMDLSKFSAWTVEAWVKPTTLDARNRRILENSINSNMSNWGQMALTASSSATTLSIAAAYGVAPSTNGLTISGSALSTGVWHHVAAVYNGSTYALYIDGTLASSAAATKTPYASSSSVSPMTVIGSNSGYSIIGNLDEIRVVTGTAVYTGNFTPSTAPFIQ